VVLQWHRPSDALGSVLLGVVVGVAAARWDQTGRPRRRQERSVDSRSVW
jgi:hypothetical protein